MLSHFSKNYVPNNEKGEADVVSCMSVTVNSEIFSRVLISRNFAYAKFRENKTLAKWQNHSVVY